MTTPMSLTIPVAGANGTVGPTYAQEVNADLQRIENHTHVPGGLDGNQVPSAGLDINADLPFNGNNATTLRAAKFTNQPASPALADLSCLYTVLSGGASVADLYFNNGNGVPIKLTAGSGLNLSIAGGISGMSGSASVQYAGGPGTYTFYSATSTYATVVAAAMQVLNGSGFGWTWRADPAQGTPSFTWEFDGSNTPPSGTLPLHMTAASGGVSKVQAAQIATAEIASLAVTAAQIANGTITTTQINSAAGIVGGQLSASAGIVGSQIAASTITVGNVLDKVSAGPVTNKLVETDSVQGTVSPSLLPQTSSDVPTFAQLVVTVPTTTNWTQAAGFGFWKDVTGMVHFKGTLEATAGSTTSIFQLPAHFRPLATRKMVAFAAYSSPPAGGGFVQVDNLGNVVVSNGFITNDIMFFDGVSFLAEQ